MSIVVLLPILQKSETFRNYEFKVSVTKFIALNGALNENDGNSNAKK